MNIHDAHKIASAFSAIAHDRRVVSSGTVIADWSLVFLGDSPRVLGKHIFDSAGSETYTAQVLYLDLPNSIVWTMNGWYRLASRCTPLTDEEAEVAMRIMMVGSDLLCEAHAMIRAAPGAKPQDQLAA